MATAISAQPLHRFIFVNGEGKKKLKLKVRCVLLI